MDSIGELVKRSHLTLVVLGVVLFVGAAIGGVPLGSQPLLITDPIWRYMIAIIGVILLGIGLYLTWREYSESKAEAQNARSGERASPSRALSPENGFLSIYFPKTNAERNSRKNEVISSAERRIQLLATTGHSYLAMVGNRFKGALINRLKSDVPIQIILLNPWSDTAVFWAFGEFVESKSQGQPPLAIEQIRQGKLTGFDPVTFIEGSVYCRRKLPESIEGYLNLKREFREVIELKFVDREIVATILLTEKSGFFEPYITVNLHERMQNLLHTFEVEFSRASYFSATCQAYFDTLWKLSISYDEFISTQEKLKSKLRQKYQWEQ